MTWVPSALLPRMRFDQINVNRALYSKYTEYLKENYSCFPKNHVKDRHAWGGESLSFPWRVWKRILRLQGLVSLKRHPKVSWETCHEDLSLHFKLNQLKFVGQLAGTKFLFVRLDLWVQMSSSHEDTCSRLVTGTSRSDFFPRLSRPNISIQWISIVS